MKVKKTDYYQGFKYCLENAIKHVEISKLAKDVSFGIAHAHLVLASEEGVKSLVLLDMHMSGKDEYPKDFSKYFSDHKYKHEVISSFETGSALIQEMLMIQWQPFVGVKPGSISLDEIKKKHKEGVQNLIKWMENLSDESNKETILDTNDYWWKQAESYKKEGFYVDLRKKQGEWTGPFKCSQNQYKKGFKIVTEFIGKIEYISEELKKPDMIELYTEMKEERGKIR